MTGTERVRNTILGRPTDRLPIYGWLSANLTDQLTQVYGSVENFEDKYEFDAAHIFGGPGCYEQDVLDRIARENGELTPDLLLDAEFFHSPDDMDKYEDVRKALSHHKARGRFCYMQTPGFFEAFNGVFGIENQLLYLAMYPDEIGELYRRQAEWNIRFAGHCIDLGVDMIHISDDWGSQKDLLFNPTFWWEHIYPNMKRVIDYVHSRGVFASLHSDGCVMKVADGIAQLGLDLVHPWQENAGMSLDVYREKYADKFAILGGICVQSAIGILPRDRLEDEIRRVFGKQRGLRWVVCTSHFVQNHCSVEDLAFAYDLIYRLAREPVAVPK